MECEWTRKSGVEEQLLLLRILRLRLLRRSGPPREHKDRSSRKEEAKDIAKVAMEERGPLLIEVHSWLLKDQK